MTHSTANSTVCMTHSTANSTHYGNVLATFNGARVVQSVRLPATGWLVLWSNSGGARISCVQTGPGTDPAASSVGKEAITSGIKQPQRGTNYLSPYRAEVKHEYIAVLLNTICVSLGFLWGDI